MLDADTTPFDSMVVKWTLKGFRHSMDLSISQKKPITIEMLSGIAQRLSSMDNSGAKAALLTGFFSFARKANLVPPSGVQFDSNKHLCRGSFMFTSWGVIMKLAHTKTIQSYERCLYVPIASISNSPICPVAALNQHFAWHPVEADAPAFYIKDRRNKLAPLTHNSLTTILKSTLSSLGYPAKEYSCHSLRRGGATFAHSCGVDIPLIQAQGDWASLSVLFYLTRPLSLRIRAARTMASNAM